MKKSLRIREAQSMARFNALQDLRRRGLWVSDLDDYWDELTDPQASVLGLRYGNVEFRSWDTVAEIEGIHRESARECGLRGLNVIKAAVRRDSQVWNRSGRDGGLWATSVSQHPGVVFGKLGADQARMDLVWEHDGVGLYQTGMPDEDRLTRHGIGFVVDVSAHPRRWNNPEREVVSYDLHDVALIPDSNVVLELAHAAAEAVRAGKPVCINCQMGWNRSGLIMGVAVWLLTGKPGGDVVDAIMTARPEALVNGIFRRFIASLPEVSPPDFESARATLSELSTPSMVAMYRREAGYDRDDETPTAGTVTSAIAALATA